MVKRVWHRIRAFSRLTGGRVCHPLGTLCREYRRGGWGPAVLPRPPRVQLSVHPALSRGLPQYLLILALHCWRRVNPLNFFQPASRKCRSRRRSCLFLNLGLPFAISRLVANRFAFGHLPWLLWVWLLRSLKGPSWSILTYIWIS